MVREKTSGEHKDTVINILPDTHFHIHFKIRKIKLRTILIIVAIIILLLAALSFLYYFIFKDALLISIATQSHLLDARQDKQLNVSFDVVSQRDLLCKSSCNSTFTDHQTMNKIFSSFILNAGATKPFSYSIRTPLKGEGQQLYSLTVTCSQQPGVACPSQQSERTETSLVAVRYEYDSNMKQQIAAINKAMASNLGNVTLLEIGLHSLDIPVNEISQKTDNNLLADYQSISQAFNQYKDRLEYFRQALNAQDYSNISLPELAASSVIASRLSALSQNTAKQQQLYSSAAFLSGQINSLLPSFDQAKANAKQYDDSTLSKSLSDTGFLISTARDEYAQTNKVSAPLIRTLNITSVSLSGSINAASMLENKAVAQGKAVIEAESLSFCSAVPGISCLNDSTSYTRMNRNIICDEMSGLIVLLSDSMKALPLNSSAYISKNQSYSAIMKYSSQYCPVPTPNNSTLFFTLQPLSSSLSSNPIQYDSTINTSIISHPPECCALGECQACAHQDRLPVLLLHGHSFDSGIDPLFSLDTFSRMQVAMENDGYVAAGSLSLFSSDSNAVPANAWSEFPFPVSVRATYYYDIYRKGGIYSLVPQKSDSIETYAVRLKDVISGIKEKTGSEKVIIVAHSMGGLVARRYMQLFGEDDVAELIMIGTPNHGIDGSSMQACTLFGAALECKDMASDSLFLNKLNDPKNNMTIPVYNLIGSGCITSGLDSDGVVTVASAELPAAANVKNIIINGTCVSVFSPLHTALVNPAQVPAVYNKVVEILNSTGK